MKPWLALAIPPLVAVGIYLPVIGFEFLAWDDPAYVTQNPVIERLDVRLVAELLSLTTHTLGAWTPTTIATYAVELRIAGPEPGLFHATNLALHALNAALLFLLLGRLGLGHLGAIAGAVLFAAHPLTVEPVAWVSARKDLLATTFSLSCVLLYLRGSGGARAAALGLFVLALGAKSSAVVVPLLLAAYHLTHRRRPSGSEWGALIAMTGLSGARSLLEAAGQADAATGSAALGIGVRLGSMVGVLGRYVRRWVAPYDLGAAYPVTYAEAWTILAGALLIVGLGIAWRASRGRPALRVGLLWWPIALLPVLNVIPAPYLETDRYQYLALIGPAVWAGFLVERGARHHRAVAIGLLVAAVIALGLRTRGLLEEWRSSEAFFDAQLTRNPDWWLGRLALALWHLGEDRTEAAEREAERVRSEVPAFGRTYHVLARIAESRDDLESAIALNRTAIRLDPTQTVAFGHNCTLLGARGQLEEAIPFCERALERNRHLPRVRLAFALVHVRLGNDADEAGRTEEALGHYDTALAIQPDLRDAYYNRGITLRNNGRYAEALADFEAAATLAPDDAHVFVQLGTVLTRLGRPSPALMSYRRAVDLDPSRVDARYSLAVLLAASGKLEEARIELERVVSERPDLADARRALEQVDRTLAHRTPPGSAP
jgi:tetratricopeptide (TPR) repeat protein